MQFKEAKPWPRRTFFIFMVLVAAITYNRVFSVILIALAFLMFEVLFTRMDNNRKVIKEFFDGYLKKDK
jgi:hypothetical protein